MQTINIKPDWTLEKAIQKQVEIEDRAMWAAKPREPFTIVPPLQSQDWGWPSVYALLSAILP